MKQKGITEYDEVIFFASPHPLALTGIQFVMRLFQQAWDIKLFRAVRKAFMTFRAPDRLSSCKPVT